MNNENVKGVILGLLATFSLLLLINSGIFASSDPGQASSDPLQSLSAVAPPDPLKLQPLPSGRQQPSAQRARSWSNEAEASTIQQVSHLETALAAGTLTVGADGNISLLSVTDSGTSPAQLVWSGPDLKKEIRVRSETVTFQFANATNQQVQITNAVGETIVALTDASAPISVPLSPGRNNLQILVYDDGGGSLLQNVEVIRPRANGLPAPVVTHLASTRPQRSTRFDTGRLYEVYGERPYLRIEGQNRDRLSFLIIEVDGEGVFQQIVGTVNEPEVVDVEGLPGSWLAHTNLPLAPSPDKSYRLLVRNESDDDHAYALPPIRLRAQAPNTDAPPPNIEKIDAKSTSTNGFFHVNKREVTISGTETIPGSVQLVAYRVGQAEPIAAATGTGTSDWQIPAVQLIDGTQDIYVQLEQGDRVLPDSRSARRTVVVRRRGPRIVGVEPENFGTTPGYTALTVLFDPQNPLPPAGPHTELATYRLLASNGSGVFDRGNETVKTHPENAAIQFDAQRNAVIIPYANVQPDVYQLTIDGSKIVDLYGNALEGRAGEQGSDYVETLGSLTRLTLDASQPNVRPGITGSTGPYVSYQEFTPPREVPDGFNPHDKVESRVARLYYYRDAHRVAQIVNRKVKSYNRQGVDMSRQLADKARNAADQITESRKEAERTAIVKAQATRRVEAELRRAELSLNRSIEELTNFRRQPRPDPDDEEAVERRAQVIQQLEASIRSFSAQVETERANVEQARGDEIQANELTQQLDGRERLARQEQFRREVAAAHTDPDTYAPGVPKSPDPVEQVSISVIGEGLIHLRGPLKGINIIRMMINQIDQPLGQVSVAVHTVQINGENESRMEDVANVIQRYIDHARFLTMQSSEMLRKAVVQVASRKADETMALYPGQTQQDRDRRYLHAFFGEEFINELATMDSEFLHTGNKILSLHSMDTTSLSSALNLLALAKNSTRLEILNEFDAMVRSELPAAEASYLEAGLTTGKRHKFDFRCPPKFYPMAENAHFESFKGFFNMQVASDDTLTPLQREFIRLAQIFKARLVTEMEYKQRVTERAIIEERGGDYQARLAEQRAREKTAKEAFNDVQKKLSPGINEVAVAIAIVDSRSAEILGTANQSSEMTVEFDAKFKQLLQKIEDNSTGDPEWSGKVQFMGEQIEFTTIIKTSSRELVTVPFAGKDIRPFAQAYKDATNQTRSLFQSLRPFLRDANTLEQLLNRLSADADRLMAQVDDTRNLADLNIDKNDSTYVDDFGIPTRDLESLGKAFRTLQSRSEELVKNYERVMGDTGSPGLLSQIRIELSSPDVDIQKAFGMWQSARTILIDFAQNEGEWPSLTEAIERVNAGMQSLLEVDIELEFAERHLERSRRPLDHKKFLDMLIDELEEKYIELLAGTRAHTANVDNYLKRLTTALDDDFNTQFYHPAFRHVREVGTTWDVQFGQIESTSILANNRQFAKVDPSATMEFDLPARDIAIAEALNGAKATIEDIGALANDPTFLALASGSINTAATPAAGSTGGFGVVRDVLPGLDATTAEDVMAHNASGRPQFGSNLENLIPDPAIYKFETGTGYEIRPVIQPDGQAVVFDFDYMYTTQVREPVRADEKHLGRIKRHNIHTDVQLSNFELREVSRYTVALKAARTSGGVPLLEDIPLAGVLFRPLPSDESSLQQNLVLSQATIFPTLFDLMGLRWAPAVSDLDPLRVTNREFVVRGRNQSLENRVYDYSSAQVDEFLRIPEGNRRTDLYRSQETIPSVHPNGYSGEGLDLRNSELQEGYQPSRAYPAEDFVPGNSKEGSPLLPGRRYDEYPGPVESYPLEEVVPKRPQPDPRREPANLYLETP